MSSKEKVVQEIRSARTQQLKWLNQIKLMVSGLLHEKDALPVNQSDSAFGKWLFNDAMIFSTSHAKSVVDEMVELHTKCYDIYLKIYATLFTASKGGLMGMFGSKKAGANDLALAQSYYEQLVAVSDKLVNRLRAFESLMLATPETKFEELIIPEQAETDAHPAETGDSADIKHKIYFRGRLIEG